MKRQAYGYFASVIMIYLLFITTVKAGYKPLEVQPSGVTAISTQDGPQIILTGSIEKTDRLSLKLFYTDKVYHEKTKEISIVKGIFRVPDQLISKPQIAYLYFSRKGKQIYLPVLLAPNYHLHLSLRIIDFDASKYTAVWSGKGSKVNDFYVAMNANTLFYDASQHVPFNDWYTRTSLKTDSLFKHCSMLFNDSKDINYKYFKDLIYKNLLFQRLDVLMKEANEMLAQQSPFEVDEYIKKHFDEVILKNISDRQYLASPSYKDLMGLSYYYLFYIFKRDQSLHPDSISNKYQAYLRKIAETFKGPVRAYVFFRFINLNLLAATNSYEAFHERAILTKPFLDKFVRGPYYTKLTNDINKKENELANLKIGDSAPAFSLPDEKGNLHSLSDFKGKIIVLDFWASWCLPCRYETPYMKKLVEKYRNDDRLCFVSIAVRDRKDAWLKALKKDAPSWLQLFDDTDHVGKSYFTQSIPKFVLINSKGKISSFDAPEPSKGDQLEDLLKKELAN